MGLYGDMMFKEDTYVNEDAQLALAESLEGTYLGMVTESIILEKSFPKELQITVDDVKNATGFKKKFSEQIKWFEENKPKKLDKHVKSGYFIIVGNTFNTMEGTYKPLMDYYVPLLNKYGSEKSKAIIKKDMENTIVALEKKEAKDLNQKQKEWLKDIKWAVTKIK